MLVKPSPFHVIDAERLREGGRFLIIPFSAGPRVAASDELDRISLRIVQGIADVLGNGKTPFEIMSATNASSAQMLLQGRIIRKESAGKAGGWLFQKKRQYLGVEGKIVDRESGQPLLVFTFERFMPKTSFDELGAIVGKDVAKKILDALAIE